MKQQEPYYSINIRIKGDEKKKIDKLRKKGLTIVGILRSGIATELRKDKK
jgi:hypothetical protein